MGPRTARRGLTRRAAPAVATGLDLSAIPVGIREDGTPWTIPLRSTHVLVAGVTGSGKSGVLWSLLRGVAPMIRDGTVAVWAIDPKAAELSLGEPLFARYEDANPAAMVDMIEDSVTWMQDRSKALKAAGQRVHVPTKEQPHVLVFIDEVANLTAYLGDAKMKARVLQGLGLLLTQGRAPGFSGVLALQDPRKEVLNLRNLIPTRIAMRLDEPIQVNMVLGEGARERGARCDEIPASLPGVGFVKVEGTREPVRVRAAYVTDDDIREMAERYRPGAPERFGVAFDGDELVAVSLRKNA